MRHLLLFIIFSMGLNALSAQDSLWYYFNIRSLEDSLQQTRFYEDARRDIVVELMEVEFSAYGINPLARHRVFYNPDIDNWAAKLSTRSTYQVRINHVGFDRYASPGVIQPSKEDKEKDILLKVKERGMASTYEVDPKTNIYEKYNYVRGELKFSETILIYFRDGLPSENRAFLENGETLKDTLGIKWRNIEQFPYATNIFLVDLFFPDPFTVEDLIYFAKNGDKKPDRTYVIGHYVSAAIERYLLNVQVAKALPVFYDNIPVERNMLEPDDYLKSLYLQRKIGDIHYSVEQGADYEKLRRLLDNN